MCEFLLLFCLFWQWRLSVSLNWLFFVLKCHNECLCHPTILIKIIALPKANLLTICDAFTTRINLLTYGQLAIIFLIDLYLAIDELTMPKCVHYWQLDRSPISILATSTLRLPFIGSNVACTNSNSPSDSHFMVCDIVLVMFTIFLCLKVHWNCEKDDCSS